ncbi:MAG: T9SS type A sorting domain-containing protein [Bacteroidia bacterium]
MKFLVKNLISVFFLFCILGASTAYSAHIAGGYITYECLGKAPNGFNQYEITVHFYKDCEGSPQFPNGNTPFDSYLRIRIYDGTTNKFINEVTASFSDSVSEEIEISNACASFTQTTCYAKATYTRVIDLPDNSNRYYLSWARCCRSSSIKNINEPDNVGLVIGGFIPSTGLCNNSPQFVDETPLVIYQDESASFDYSAIDPDGDSLAYELITPSTAGDRLDPIPTPLPPPHATVSFLPSYSQDQPFGTLSDFQFDNNNGQLDITPEESGIYILALKVKEYREGQLISELFREITVNVISRTDMGYNCPDTLGQQVISDLQNSPNPFLYSTTFHFHLKSSGNLKLEVFDTSGRRVAILADEYVEKGYHNIEWTPSGLARGIYIYRIQLGDEFIARKMRYMES